METSEISENQNHHALESNAALETPKEPQKSQTQEAFTILGPKEAKQSKTKVKHVLARWLLEPTVISADLSEKTKTSTLKNVLDKSLLKQLKGDGVRHLFPVQSAVIPWLLETNSHKHFIAARDICVCAPTGSGKTLAFVLPVVQVLRRHVVRKVRALVILPTQDLATQVFKVFKSYAAETSLETCLITGTHSFEIEQKQLLYHNACYEYVSKIDILVCTAGRLVKHLKSTPGFDLKSLEFLIIDEADRVLDNIQDDWLYHLEKHIHPDSSGNSDVINLETLKSRSGPQKLLFSATLSQSPEKLQKLALFLPKLFSSVVHNASESNEMEEKKFARPTELAEKYLVCLKEAKPLVLYTLIKKDDLRKTIVFTNSIESAHRLAILLRALFKTKRSVEEISSSLKRQSRDELINKFSSGEIDILICTDSLARGIDLPNVECVISYESPKHLKTYIHRAGRTARAGASGSVVTILHKEQVHVFKSMLADENHFSMEQIDISQEDLQSKESRYRKALSLLKTNIETEHESGLLKQKSLKKSQTRRKSLGKSSVMK